MGLYSTVTRASGTVLTGFGSTSDIYNTDHKNHVIHTEPLSINSHEVQFDPATQTYQPDVPTMGLQTDPAPTGTPVIVQTFASELEHLRFALATIKRALSGGTMPLWYTATASISSLVVMPATAVRIEQSGNFPVPSGTLTTVHWNTVNYDTTAGKMVVGTSPILLGLQAPVTGVYLVGASVAFGDGISNGPVEDFQLHLVQGASTEIASSQNFTNTTAGPKSVTAETLVQLPGAGESPVDSIVTCQVFQNGGTTKNLTQDLASDSNPAFWMALVGR